MSKFVRVNNTLINVDRLLMIRRKPEDRQGSFHSTEHYLAIFETGREVRLSPEDGLLLVEECSALNCVNPPENAIATAEAEH